MEENLKQRSNRATEISKVALFGPESTGKTTLARQLAAHYKTEWVPEFARDYLQQKWDENQQICALEDMLPIAVGQVQLENEFAIKANKYLFCDTNLMVTKVFSEVYYNYCDPLLHQAACQHEYDLIFLTDIDVPWEKDDLRDKPQGRESVFAVFKQALLEHKKPFITLSGDQELRLNKAIRIIDDLRLAKSMGFSTADFLQIYQHGIAIQNIQTQLNFFRNGITPIDLVSPAKLSHGILKLSDKEFEEKAAFFDAHKTDLKLNKFVPASGAASRMFKFLNEFLNEFDDKNESINAYINRKKASELSIFIVGMEKFPFFEAVYAKLKEEFENFDSLDRNLKNFYFVKVLLSGDDFDFANKPKGVLPFHDYKTHIVTPIEEHLLECMHYSSSNKGSSLHFTVSESHQHYFETTAASSKVRVEKLSGMPVDVSYSYQNQSTDTIAVTLDNKPFRDASGQLVFRPGGHGALIENLNNLEADIVFIKNIDNVIQNNIDKITLYKKGLAGILLLLQQDIFEYLRVLEEGVIDKEVLQNMVLFITKKLNVTITTDFFTEPLERKIEVLKSILNKPIRVCGMVKNEGEPGGGPFWVRDNEGGISLQIVESSQVNLNNQEQRNIAHAATHFNPVDLVCGIKNYKNEKFDLTQFIDPNSGFVVEKNAAGIAIKGYELPGLWNGAMANWLTVFVQVPLITFNPVKTVNDLLKPLHQP